MWLWITVPIHERLGISREEFDAHLSKEIDEVLVPRQEQENSTRETPPPAPAMTSEPLHVMTKEDVLRHLGNRAITTGAELGMYKWAADLGWARFGYDYDLERDEAYWLAAYDET